MKPFPIELRQRIVDAVDQQLGSNAEIAEIFGVTERYVYKLLALRRDTGELAPKPHGGGAIAKIKDEEHLLPIVEMVAEQPDATLVELKKKIKSRLRVTVCAATVSNALARWGLPRKKKHDAPHRQTPSNKPSSKRGSRRYRANK
jgi:transposase